ncbi:MAG: hypothetical protein K6V97_11395 [Actinomycetia bacterium]|nr:hypothetical protein [Actinomycetes bacterium]
MLETTLKREKETARTVRFAEDAGARGEPEAIGTLYIQKWAWTQLGQPGTLRVTLSAEAPAADAAPIVLTFAAEKETRNTRRFIETSAAEGRPEVVGTLYVQKWALTRLGTADRLYMTLAAP